MPLYLKNQNAQEKQKASKDVAPDGDSIPPVVKGIAIKEDNPLPEPEPEPVKQNENQRRNKKRL